MPRGRYFRIATTRWASRLRRPDRNRSVTAPAGLPASFGNAAGFHTSPDHAAARGKATSVSSDGVMVQSFQQPMRPARA